MFDEVDELAAKEAELASMKKRFSEVQAELTRYGNQLAAMSEDADKARKETHRVYRERHNQRFSDLNYKSALIGGRTRHTITIGGMARYFIALPNGHVWSKVNAFVDNPVTAAPEPTPFPQDMAAGPKPGTALGKVTDAERSLLAFLVGVQQVAEAPNPQPPEVDLSSLPLWKKLDHIRTMPEMTTVRLAEEAFTMQAWLNIILEAELGN